MLDKWTNGPSLPIDKPAQLAASSPNILATPVLKDKNFDIQVPPSIVFNSGIPDPSASGANYLDTVVAINENINVHSTHKIAATYLFVKLTILNFWFSTLATVYSITNPKIADNTPNIIKNSHIDGDIILINQRNLLHFPILPFSIKGGISFLISWIEVK